MNTRREFMKTLAVGGISVPLLDLSLLAAERSPPGGASAPNPIGGLFPGFSALTAEEKIRRIERLTSAARAHPSGIFVCMAKVTPEGFRQVRPSDFDGMDQFMDNFGLKFRSATDFFNNENSITNSGSHLAAQSVRFLATGEPEALAAARTAYGSLRRIFEFGVQHGRPGFMGKPYHFEFSTHTTGDQYLHALWGLWSFYPVASTAEQAEIRAMIKATADYQLAVDFAVFYENGRNWNYRKDPTDYNAIMAALVAAAYKLTGERKYFDACEQVMLTGRWRTHNRLDLTIEEMRAGKWKVPPWEVLVGPNKRPGEFAHWEQIIHCQFTAIAASIIHECAPGLLSAEELDRTVSLWWADHGMGFDREYWGYLYWFLVSSQDRSWRACARTERAPKEQWIGGHPMLSYSAAWIFGECLTRFLWTAMVAARHCPRLRDEAAAFGAETFRRLEPRHLLWISDPDGRQVPPELRYFTEFLSSEVPEGMIASYWEGRRLKLWS
jgi:hypothetical protein